MNNDMCMIEREVSKRGKKRERNESQKEQSCREISMSGSARESESE